MEQNLFRVKFHTKERREDEHAKNEDREFEGVGDSKNIVATGAEQAIAALRKDQIGVRTEFDLDDEGLPPDSKGVAVVTDITVTGVELIGSVDFVA